MKTLMIRDVLTVVSVGGPLSDDAPDAAARAIEELKALEESHAEMARALQLLLSGWGETNVEEAKDMARAALRKAGVL